MGRFPSIDIEVDYTRQDGAFELWIGNSEHDLFLTGHTKPVCPDCHGIAPDEYDRFYGDYCETCRGNERVSVWQWVTFTARLRWNLLTWRECPLCGAWGTLPAAWDRYSDESVLCHACEGKGYVRLPRWLYLHALRRLRDLGDRLVYWWRLHISDLDCPACHGRGRLESTPDVMDAPDPGYPCPYCDEGRVSWLKRAWLYLARL